MRLFFASSPRTGTDGGRGAPRKPDITIRWDRVPDTVADTDREAADYLACGNPGRGQAASVLARQTAPVILKDKAGARQLIRGVRYALHAARLRPRAPAGSRARGAGGPGIEPGTARVRLA